MMTVTNKVDIRYKKTLQYGNLEKFLNNLSEKKNIISDFVFIHLINNWYLWRLFGFPTE